MGSAGMRRWLDCSRIERATKAIYEVWNGSACGSQTALRLPNGGLRKSLSVCARLGSCRPRITRTSRRQAGPESWCNAGVEPHLGKTSVVTDGDGVCPEGGGSAYHGDSRAVMNRYVCVWRGSFVLAILTRPAVIWWAERAKAVERPACAQRMSRRSVESRK